MLPRIETSDVIRRAVQIFRDHDEKCPLVTHVRKTGRGEIVVERREGTIPESVTTTFHGLLTDYVKNYNAMRAIMPLEFQSTDRLPALFTNSSRVGNYARCSGRTVRNHLTRLKKLNMVETKSHGKKKDMEVWIKPEILFGKPEPILLVNAPETPLSAPERKNFPEIYTQGQIKIEKGKDEKDIFILQGQNAGQGQKERTDREPQGLEDTSEEHGERFSAAGAAARRRQIAAENRQKMREKNQIFLDEQDRKVESQKPRIPEIGGKTLPRFYAEMLAQFWIYAMRVIYTNRLFSKEEQEKALVAICSGVYGNFSAQNSQAQWQKFQIFQLQKLEKAAKYFESHPTAYKPDPYSVYIPGKGYFDLANGNGFIGVEKWMKSDQLKKIYRSKASNVVRREKLEAEHAQAEQKKHKIYYVEKQLEQARRDFERLRQEVPRAFMAKYDHDALFSYYNAVFAGQGGKWQEIFLNQYMTQKARDFMPPAHLRPRRKDFNFENDYPAEIVYVEGWMGELGEGYYIE